MAISTHMQELYGLPAHDFPTGEPAGGLPDAASVAWRVSVDAYESDEAWEEAFARFTAAVDPGAVTALVVGAWSDVYDSAPDEVVEALVASSRQFPRLRALFLGDITFDECEISWIHQGLVTPLLDAFPDLHEFGVRGGQDLRFPAVRHEHLRSLTIETGGLDAEVVRGVAASDFPALERLDLWLGTSWYGGTAEPADLAPILAGARLPRLRYLALRNSQIQDEIATALAGAPVVAGLETLDLSMGALGDDGVEALLAGQPLTHLKKLDLHHHFVGEALRERLRATLGAAGVEIDLSDVQEEEDREDRYTAVAE
ncbi:STM4015 family protein [Streptomyces liangshanensis]|uniref:Leucine-rich repeat domain-containing protein n=1 Tax=Streptomyces liangshanensis TaxID=2717324 RepID=A0A6G9GUA6_9ACTN|nr:STM4015 family protein [Streptomyces liangshanensis]QIQ01601.1 leucine-rich repeat domain-containing protein [Streptomyces liangshanensis]